MKINCPKIIAGVALFLLVFIKGSTPVLASGESLSLSPATISLLNGSQQTFTVTINTGSTQVFGADAIITVPTAAFDVVSVSNGTFFTDLTYSNQNGVLSIHGYFSSLYQYKAGTGPLATFILKAKQGTGTATVPLECNTSAQTSKITDSNGMNVLTCSNVNQSTITLTGSITPSPTPTPTGVPNPTVTPTGGTSPTNTPTPTPTGNQKPSCNGLSIKPLTGIKPITVSFTCAGYDPNNDITAAEFDFGNSTKKTIEKGVGQFGSITTTNTYTTTGTYAVTCRVRDNNQAFSDIPNRCKGAVKVTATGATTSTDTSLDASLLLSKIPTPTPTLIVLVPYESPTTTPSIIATPTPKPTGNSWFSGSKFSQLITMIVVSAITIILALMLHHYFDKP